ncbi:MAG: hypothetical protein J5859_04700, partial [Clostridia bacterium]|nr:hypothetical protein [Clostridia bacterium]
MAVPSSLFCQLCGVEEKRTAFGGVDHRISFLREAENGTKGRLIRISAGKLAAIRFGAVCTDPYPCDLAIFKNEENAHAIILREYDGKHAFLLIHLELAGQKNAKCGSTGILKVTKAGFIDLAAVAENQQFTAVQCLEAHEKTVVLFELLFAAHAEGLRGDLFQVSVAGDKDRYGIIRYFFLRFDLRQFVLIQDRSAPRFGILLDYLLELRSNDGFDPVPAFE